MTVIFSIIFFVTGLILRPIIIRWLKKTFQIFYESKIKRFEIDFKIEFYSQPSIHHLGEEGTLVKTDKIKVQIDAETTDEALDFLDIIIKKEVRAELVEIKEIQKM